MQITRKKGLLGLYLRVFVIKEFYALIYGTSVLSKKK